MVIVLTRLNLSLFFTSRSSMAKRPAEDLTDGGVSLKSGDRPKLAEGGNEVEDFEDEFEDEYESEDEIIEAGVDGRPDEEREAEEKGMWITPKSTVRKPQHLLLSTSANKPRKCYGR